MYSHKVDRTFLVKKTFFTMKKSLNNELLKCQCHLPYEYVWRNVIKGSVYIYNKLLLIHMFIDKTPVSKTWHLISLNPVAVVSEDVRSKVDSC